MAADTIITTKKQGRFDEGQSVLFYCLKCQTNRRDTIIEWDDHVKEECGVCGIWSEGDQDVSWLIYQGLLALQHRGPVSYTHLRAHETRRNIVVRYVL